MCSLLSRAGINHVPSQMNRTVRGLCFSNELVAMGNATAEGLLCISNGGWKTSIFLALKIGVH